VVVFAGNYSQPDDWVMPVEFIEQYVAPELRRKSDGTAQQ
jgi:hypothetical protein